MRNGFSLQLVSYLAEGGMNENGGILGGLNWLTKQNPSVLIALMLAGSFLLIFIEINMLTKDWFERICWSIVVLSSFLLIVGFIHSKYTKYKTKNNLHRLTKQECSVLNEYIKKDTLSAHPNKGTGPYLSLMKDGILYYAGERNEAIDVINLHRWIFDYLTKHPELLKPTT
jgi:hypothetical protein